MAARTQPPALETVCQECGEPFEDTRSMRPFSTDMWVHSHECEGFSLEPGITAPLIVFLSALVGFFGGILLLEALGWLRDAAVVLACIVCVALAWGMWRGES